MQKQLPNDVLKYLFTFLNGRQLSTVSLVCKKWKTLSDDQKNIWKKKLKEEKGIDFDPKNFPTGFLEAHPIDYKALYFKVRNIPFNKLFNNSAFYHYKYYVVLCALVGGRTFWDALQLHGKPQSLSTFTSYYIAGTFAFSGDLESLKLFDESSLEERGILLEGAVQGSALNIIEYLIAQIEGDKNGCLQICYGWALEYLQPAVIEFLETKYNCQEPIVEDNPYYCLDKAICSDSVPLVSRFVNHEKVPAHFLHLAASQNAISVFWYGVNVLGLDINTLDSHGWMPIHYVASNGSSHKLLQQIAHHPNCCLHLRHPRSRKAIHQPAYYLLLKIAVSEDSGRIIRLLHREFKLDLSIVNPETGNTLAHECCMKMGSISAFRYLVLYGNINFDHANLAGKTIAQCVTLYDLKNPFHSNANLHYFYVQHVRVVELL
ncbi:MAG: F-box protein, partial [Pseudomonadota bacterium]|nr:F-box protein [Pseudomonadota bacterium]